MSERNGVISRREFIKIGGTFALACLLESCGLGLPDNAGSGNGEVDLVNSNNIDPAVEKLDNLWGKLEREGEVNRNINGVMVLPDNQILAEVRQGIDISYVNSVFASAIAPAVIEPTPAGEVALLVLGGAAAVLAIRNTQAQDSIEFIELNSHSIERRGEELAGLIKTIVEAAFLDPNSPFKNKKMICAVGVGIVQGCDAVIHLAVEVTSRTKPGETRIASIIFARDTQSGEYRQITALYTKDKSLEDYTRRRMESLKRKGIHATIAACNSFPPPDQLLAGN